MKSIVDAKEFSAALKKVIGVLKHSRIPELEQVKVDFAGNTCRLSATDFTGWMVTELPAKGDIFSLIFANTKAVERACHYFSGELTVELNEGKNATASLSCEDRRGEFPLLDAGLYPALPDVAAERSYTVNAASILGRVKKVSYATRHTDQRPELNGVRFEGTHIWCVDGARMAVTSDDTLKVEGRFLLPGYVLGHLKVFGDSEITMEVGKRYVAFQDGMTTLLSDTIFTSDGLHVESILANQGNQIRTLDRKRFLDGVKYLESCSQGMKKPFVLCEDGTLYLESSGATFQATVMDPGKCPGVFSFDNRHMKDALGQFFDSDGVKLRVGQFPSPIVLFSEKTGNLALVLPVRMKNMTRQQAA